MRDRIVIIGNGMAGLKLVEVAPGVTREEVQAKTGVPLH